MCCYFLLHFTLRGEVRAAVGCKYPQIPWDRLFCAMMLRSKSSPLPGILLVGLLKFTSTTVCGTAGVQLPPIAASPVTVQFVDGSVSSFSAWEEWKAAASMYCGWKPRCQVINEHQSGFFDAQTENTYFFSLEVWSWWSESKCMQLFLILWSVWLKNASHL